MNPHSDIDFVFQCFVLGDRIPELDSPYLELVDVLSLELDSEGCQCHKLPKQDMDGGRFRGMCNFCAAHAQENYDVPWRHQ